MKPTVQLLTGHCVDELDKLEPQSVQCVVSSLPYLWLRDYAFDFRAEAPTTEHDDAQTCRHFSMPVEGGAS